MEHWNLGIMGEEPGIPAFHRSSIPLFQHSDSVHCPSYPDFPDHMVIVPYRRRQVETKKDPDGSGQVSGKWVYFSQFE
jgi:hypothetical protein